MKKIGMVYAMEGELASLLADSNAKKLETVSGVHFYEIAPQIIACAGGVGKVNTAMATQLMLVRYAPDMILNAGVAGSMVDLPIGTLVLAEQFVQHDVDTSAVGDPVGLVSTINRIEFPCDHTQTIHDLLNRMDVAHHRGLVATGDWFVTDSDRARTIQAQFRPMLCEMEGGAIAQVCYRNGVPFAALKSVSDRLFSEQQPEEYFNFPAAMARLNEVMLPLATQLLEVL